jgi:hypothetical protein
MVAQLSERITCAGATLSPIRLSVLVQHVKGHQPGYSMRSTRFTQIHANGVLLGGLPGQPIVAMWLRLRR